MKELYSGKMTEKGQLTIPSDLREHWDIGKGDRLAFVLNENGEVVVKPKKKSIVELFGILKTDIKYDEYEAKRSIAEHVVQKHKEVTERDG
ncbi:AbrB/MazE/SpoVT family DNA-binding domain-containing protein [Paenibacillus agaridevorans]|uniref:AbrB/MazE/SpoVT family DNA-binding domain-containing protein n=1 Tax=Paenibacillus agaridevorans TaxID=171404 RepID=UPI001BE3E6A2|nr:AbrB/MazE/SpoVT family DNA-binding domain-containing protein [Paenibacillus agaridevorans]